MIELVNINFTQSNFINLKKETETLFDTHEFEVAKNFFLDIFAEIGAEAINGNVVCQDFLAYLYKNGYQNLIPENYELYMKWEILAAANGNCTAIDKMMMFFNYALSTIYEHNEFNSMIAKNNINENSAVYIFSKLLAEGIVDELKIDPKELVKMTEREPYSMAKFRIFRNALDAALPEVIRFLLS